MISALLTYPDSCLHQKHSFRPIHVTKNILQALSSRLDISPDFLEILSNFYQKVTDLEETYCAPLVVQENADYFGTSLPIPQSGQSHR
jgi:hypothetical protein